MKEFAVILGLKQITKKKKKAICFYSYESFNYFCGRKWKSGGNGDEIDSRGGEYKMFSLFLKSVKLKY